MVTGVFGSFMLTCNMGQVIWNLVNFGSFMLTSFIKLSWLSFSDSEPACKINHFWNKNAFLDGFMWFLVFLAPVC